MPDLLRDIKARRRHDCLEGYQIRPSGLSTTSSSYAMAQKASYRISSCVRASDDTSVMSHHGES